MIETAKGAMQVRLPFRVSQNAIPVLQADTPLKAMCFAPAFQSNFLECLTFSWLTGQGHCTSCPSGWSSNPGDSQCFELNSTTLPNHCREHLRLELQNKNITINQTEAIQLTANLNKTLQDLQQDLADKRNEGIAALQEFNDSMNEEFQACAAWI